ncbi:MAG: hypothetical protein IKP73_14795 [Bacteroidales bacterium]|nr:hypothetical protein [Bacteroidales bacterium]
MTKERWRGDKNLPRVYPEANSGSDLVSNHDGQPFAPIATDVLSCGTHRGGCSQLRPSVVVDVRNLSRRGGCFLLRQICNLTQTIIRICNP